jgi:hypothetical protein
LALQTGALSLLVVCGHTAIDCGSYHSATFLGPEFLTLVRFQYGLWHLILGQYFGKVGRLVAHSC